MRRISAFQWTVVAIVTGMCVLALDANGLAQLPALTDIGDGTVAEANTTGVSSSKTLIRFLGIPALSNITRELQSYRGAQARLATQGIDLAVDLVPTLSTTDYSRFLTTLLARYNSSEYDVILIDVVWPGQLAAQLLDIEEVLMNMPGKAGGEAGVERLRSMHVTETYEASRVAGRQVGLPFFGDFGVLFYRTDLLDQYNFTSPPKTWQEMELMMSVILPEQRKRNPRLAGYVGQFEAYEGLTCNLVEWLGSAGADGGHIVESDGKVSIGSSPGAREVLDLMRSWFLPPKSYIPLAALHFLETESYKMWLKGDILFHRNWPFLNTITLTTPSFPTHPKTGRPAFAITSLPGYKDPSLRGAATLGGLRVAVNRNSKNPEAAVLAAIELSSAQFQRERFDAVGVVPTVKAIFQDPEFCRQSPLCDLYDSLRITPRPSAATAPKYLAVSEKVYVWTNRILRGDISVRDGLKKISLDVMEVTGLSDGSLIAPALVAYNFPASIGLLANAAFLTTPLILYAILTCLLLPLETRKFSQLEPTRFSPTTSIPFTVTVAFGVALGQGGMVLELGKPERWKCIVGMWAEGLGSSVVCAAAAIKMFWGFTVQNNKFTIQRIPFHILFPSLIALLSPILLHLTVFTVVSPKSPGTIGNPNNSDEEHLGCLAIKSPAEAVSVWGAVMPLKLGQDMEISLTALKGALWLLVLAVAWLARDLKMKWWRWEVWGWSVAVFTAAVACGILKPLSLSNTMMDFPARLIANGVATQISSLCFSLALLLPDAIALIRRCYRLHDATTPGVVRATTVKFAAGFKDEEVQPNGDRHMLRDALMSPSWSFDHLRGNNLADSSLTDGLDGTEKKEGECGVGIVVTAEDKEALQPADSSPLRNAGGPNGAMTSQLANISGMNLYAFLPVTTPRDDGMGRSLDIPISELQASQIHLRVEPSNPVFGSPSWEPMNMILVRPANLLLIIPTSLASRKRLAAIAGLSSTSAVMSKSMVQLQSGQQGPQQMLAPPQPLAPKGTMHHSKTGSLLMLLNPFTAASPSGDPSFEPAPGVTDTPFPPGRPVNFRDTRRRFRSTPGRTPCIDSASPLPNPPQQPSNSPPPPIEHLLDALPDPDDALQHSRAIQVVSGSVTDLSGEELGLRGLLDTDFEKRLSELGSTSSNAGPPSQYDDDSNEWESSSVRSSVSSVAKTQQGGSAMGSSLSGRRWRRRRERYVLRCVVNKTVCLDVMLADEAVKEAWIKAFSKAKWSVERHREKEMGQ
ncbi:hypothetical protein HDU96_002045 [Phlyctochytrium bullatum]|nr:hypothetical protein HDU96_002045 [Phlyctochytrium bullatum]